MPPANATVLTVSQISTQIKDTLEGAFQTVWVVGEVSSLTLARSGHLYFNLKDGGAVVRAVVWRSTVQRLAAVPREGAEIIVRGKLSVYLPRGDYQLVLEEIHAKGIGAQDLALRKLKERLAQLGYFAPERKRPLPRHPRRIAIVSSPTGAAIRDMLEILRDRWPAAEVWVLSVLVQGPGAPESITNAFAVLDMHAGVDVVILGRGGGSSDDLSAFNDERIAHAIFRCKFPVVSAVGHEIDVTIADMVADRRALTPSEAAVLSTPDRADLLDGLRQMALRMDDLLRSKVQAGKQRLVNVAERRVFAMPLERLRDRERALDEWSERLQRAMQKRVVLANKSVELHAAQLESLSPLNVLARGYSLTRTLPDRHVVRGIAEVEVGDAIEIVLHDGRLTARVEERMANGSIN
jgi:exodeoxyribonuclease VII large subunit